MHASTVGAATDVDTMTAAMSAAPTAEPPRVTVRKRAHATPVVLTVKKSYLARDWDDWHQNGGTAKEEKLSETSAIPKQA